MFLAKKKHWIAILLLIILGIIMNSCRNKKYYELPYSTKEYVKGTRVRKKGSSSSPSSNLPSKKDALQPSKTSGIDLSELTQHTSSSDHFIQEPIFSGKKSCSVHADVHKKDPEIEKYLKKIRTRKKQKGRGETPVKNLSKLSQEEVKIFEEIRSSESTKEFVYEGDDTETVIELDITKEEFEDKVQIGEKFHTDSSLISQAYAILPLEGGNPSSLYSLLASKDETRGGQQ